MSDSLKGLSLTKRSKNSRPSSECYFLYDHLKPLEIRYIKMDMKNINTAPPTQSINNLIEYLTSQEHISVKTIDIKKQGDITITGSRQGVYFLISGAVEVQFISSGRVVAVIAKPIYPIGLVELYSELSNLKYRAKAKSRFLYIDKASWEKIQCDSNMLKDTLSVVSHMFFLLSLYAELSLNNDLYLTVRSLIYFYMQKQAYFLGNKEGLAKYISSRVNISKSQMYRILKELKSGGYIVLDEKGCLIEIKKNLPLRY